jgi:hypothetical protein
VNKRRREGKQRWGGGDKELALSAADRIRC